MGHRFCEPRQPISVSTCQSVPPIHEVREEGLSKRESMGQKNNDVAQTSTCQCVPPLLKGNGKRVDLSKRECVGQRKNDAAPQGQPIKTPTCQCVPPLLKGNGKRVDLQQAGKRDITTQRYDTHKAVVQCLNMPVASSDT